MSKDTASPARRQYLDIKKEYPDAILFFRMGDFYETFDEDAETASKILDIVLTQRSVGKGQRVPMAGIPYHAAENYLGRLVENGYHVAICEQVGDQPMKGIFPRKVVRVVTAGTLLEPGLLPGDANNYLVALVQEGQRAGIAHADISTGEFAVTQIESPQIGAEVRAELIRLSPAERLTAGDGEPDEGELPGHHTAWPAWRFESGRCEDVLLKQFDAGSLDGFGLRGKGLAVRAAGALLQYVSESQNQALKLLTGLSVYSLDDFMNLDAATRRNLELTETIRGGRVSGSLLDVLDQTVTPMGKRLMRRWVSKPLLNVEKVKSRQAGVAVFFDDGLLRAEIRTALRPMADLERLSNRIMSGNARPGALVAMRSTLQQLPVLHGLLPRGEPALQSVLEHYQYCKDELSLLERAIEDEPPATLANVGVIRPGFSEELDGILHASSHAREWIANLESVERERTGIKVLKVGYNKVFGYYIEVTRANSDSVPEHYIRKQTLVNAERYITPEMKEYETQVLNAEERIREVERRIFNEVCSRLSDAAARVQATADALAQIDGLAALAETASLYGYHCPEVVADDVLEIQDARHPVVEHSLLGSRFVPNDVVFDPSERVRIITGPNMSGKSTYLRQVALIVLMAQMGSYVPAASAKIGLVDRIFTRIGAQDEIHAGQSTFMVEMVEAANILNHATPRSLVVLDEIGRGTSTYDGLSIAWAVVEYIHNHPEQRSKTLFATHYHELTQLADLLPGVRNYSVAVSEADGKVIFLHKIVAGGADRSYGIHVAQLAGLPGPVIHRANEILQDLENHSGKAIEFDPDAPQQLAMFPETNPLLDELGKLDLNTLSPIEALNRLYEWQLRFQPPENQKDRP